MKIVIKNVGKDRAVSAVQTALTFLENYVEIKPHRPVIMGKQFIVHNTATGTVVVQPKP